MSPESREKCGAYRSRIQLDLLSNCEPIREVSDIGNRRDNLDNERTRDRILKSRQEKISPISQWKTSLALPASMAHYSQEDSRSSGIRKLVDLHTALFVIRTFGQASGSSDFRGNAS